MVALESKTEAGRGGEPGRTISSPVERIDRG